MSLPTPNRMLCVSSDTQQGWNVPIGMGFLSAVRRSLESDCKRKAPAHHGGWCPSRCVWRETRGTQQWAVDPVCPLPTTRCIVQKKSESLLLTWEIAVCFLCTGKGHIVVGVVGTCVLEVRIPIYVRLLSKKSRLWEEQQPPYSS